MTLTCFTEKKNLEVEKNLRKHRVMVKQNDSIKNLASSISQFYTYKITFKIQSLFTTMPLCTFEY